MKLTFTLLAITALFGSTLALPAEISNDNINAKRDQIQFEICINKDEVICQVLNLGVGDCLDLGNGWSKGVSYAKSMSDHECELFDKPQCQGHSVTAEGRGLNLKDVGFNDKAMSVQCGRH